MTPGPTSGRADDAPLGWELPFVGRETPLAALVSAVQAAELGERVLALVAGEPGIGKTRLVREAVSRVSSPVLWATCWDGEGAPAYWPWSQLLRALFADGADGAGDGGGFGPQPGPGQLSVLLGDAPAPEVSVGARFRLFDAVAGAFAEASRRRPIVVVIEDLHWADEASVQLLELLAHDSRPRRLAVIGTYRQAAVTAGGPLADRLGELVRDGVHLSLGGLGRRDVEILVGSVTRQGVDVAGLVPLLLRKSGGNPFFLQELLRHVDAEGSFAATADVASPVPGGVRAVVARRLGGLSAATREVLAGAAVMGAEFDPLVLAPATGRSGDDLFAALDEAVSAGLVTTHGDGGRFAFVHAIVREVLYEGLSLAERAATHRRVAEEIERRYGDARLAELAHHVLQGAGPGDERAVDVAVRAAKRSLAGLAYEDAAAWYRRALAALRSGPHDNGREAELLLHHGETHLWAGDLPAARHAYEQVATIARARHDAELLARAALGLGTGFGGFEVKLLDPVQVELLEEALGALGPERSPLRAWVLARLSVALSFIGDDDRRRDLSEQAVATARAVGDLAALGYALAGHCDAIAGPDHCETRLAESSEVVRLARQVPDRQLELLGRRLRLVALLETGDVAEADAEIERFALVADGLRQPLYRWYVPLWRGMRALMRRDLDEAAKRRAEAEELGEMAHSDNAFALTFTQWWVQERYEGRCVEAGRAMAEALGDSDHSGPPITVGPRAVAALQTGDTLKARVLLEQWVEAGLHERLQDSEWLPEAAQKAEAAVVAGSLSVAETLYGQLRPYAHRFCVEGIGAAFTGSVAWYIALLARFLGHDEEAAGYEAQARAAHRRAGLVGDPPPLASPAPPPPVLPGAPRPATSQPAGTPSLILEGATWAVTYAGATQRLRDSKGLRDLAVLLAQPGQEVHCLDLVGGVDVGAEAGPVLDQRARRAYEGRIRDLQADVDEARAGNDMARAERAEAELDALVQQLSEAFGLSGRARATGSATERARSAVGWRIRDALRHAAEVHPELGRHLQNSVRTGTWCSYRPEVSVPWEIEDGKRTETQGRRA